MNNYSIVVNKETLTFDLMEKTTGNLVGTASIYDNCVRFLKKLENGSGFKNYTPKFFCDPPLNLDK